MRGQRTREGGKPARPRASWEAAAAGPGGAGTRRSLAGGPGEALIGSEGSCAAGRSHLPSQRRFFCSCLVNAARGALRVLRKRVPWTRRCCVLSLLLRPRARPARVGAGPRRSRTPKPCRRPQTRLRGRGSPRADGHAAACPQAVSPVADGRDAPERLRLHPRGRPPGLLPPAALGHGPAPGGVRAAAARGHRWVSGPPRRGRTERREACACPRETSACALLSAARTLLRCRPPPPPPHRRPVPAPPDRLGQTPPGRGRSQTPPLAGTPPPGSSQSAAAVPAPARSRGGRAGRRPPGLPALPRAPSCERVEKSFQHSLGWFRSRRRARGRPGPSLRARLRGGGPRGRLVRARSGEV